MTHSEGNQPDTPLRADLLEDLCTQVHGGVLPNAQLPVPARGSKRAANGSEFTTRATMQLEIMRTLHQGLKATFRNLTWAWPLVIFLLLPAHMRAETAVQAWVQRYHGPGNGADWAWALAVDGSNNVIVTGPSVGKASYYYDYATIKYSSAGVPLWTNRYNGPANRDDHAHGVAVDGNNNVIVTGYSTGTSGWADYATIKYSNAGVPLWTNRYNGPGNGNDYAYAVAVDGSNNVIVTGYSYGSENTNDYATIKYSSAGVPLWTNRYNGPGNGDDQARAVAADANNNVIVAGYSRSERSGDYATIMYSSAGVPLWTNRCGWLSSTNIPCALAVDGSNNVIVTGYSYGKPTETVPNYATLKYSGAGVPLWTNHYNGGSASHPAMAVDGSNDVIVTGCLWNQNNGDYATIKYSGAGGLLWTNRYNGPGNSLDLASAVAVDRSNNVIVTGYSILARSGNADYATIKYSSAGVPLWTNRYDGPGNGNDYAYAVAVDRNRNVIVVGHSVGSAGNDDFATIKYVCIPSPVMTGLQRDQRHVPSAGGRSVAAWHAGDQGLHEPGGLGAGLYQHHAHQCALLHRPGCRQPLRAVLPGVPIPVNRFKAPGPGHSSTNHCGRIGSLPTGRHPPR